MQKIKRFLWLLHEWIALLIAPPYCAACQNFLTQRSILCSTCQDSIKPIISLNVPLSHDNIMQVLALSAYEFPLKQLISGKHRSYRLASVHLGHLMGTMMNKTNIPCDYMIPIPQHWSRTFKRGYNPIAVITETMRDVAEKPLSMLLKRTKRTSFQSSLSPKKRASNVRSAFALTIQPHQYAQYMHKHIVLVDDLYTTGATIKAAARALLVLQPASIRCIVACRVI